MDVDAVEASLEAFSRRNAVTFERLGTRQTQVLELAAIVGVSQHYIASGFTVTAVNPRRSTEFVVKAGTRGHPSDYSRVRCERDGDAVELHSNLLVQGAHDDGKYCVDVGITTPDIIPLSKGLPTWERLPNADLLSFVEVKKLVVYPMLLAQFLGIVHEIKPAFLSLPAPVGFGRGEHLPPTLVALGHYSSNSSQIVEAFARRGFSFLIRPSFDIRLAWSRRDPLLTPFYGQPDDGGSDLDA